MKTKRRVFGLYKVLACVALTVLLTAAFLLTASAADLEWNLLTDTEAGYRMEDWDGTWNRATEEDGTPYVYNENDKNGALYIFDDGNILGSYLTFSLEGDFYFSSFPYGTREGKTPDENPLSFLCWIYNNKETGAAAKINSIRLDSEGYLHTAADGSGKTDVKLETGRWYNIRCVFTPKNGVSEVFLDGKKVLDFSIARFEADRHVSGAVRYFDRFYSFGAKMKNIIVKTNSDYTVELKREAAADYLAYQTTKPESGAFSARVVLGLNGTDYNRVGYEVAVLTRDEDGNLMSEGLSQKTKVIYETLVDADGKAYNIQELYGYNYAAALEIGDLPLEPTGDSFELVVRPFVLGMDGIRRYGVACSLVYNGRRDEAGYPMLIAQSGKRYSVEASEDTFIYNSITTSTANNGGEDYMVVRNPGNEGTDQFRAAYFKFTLNERAVKALETATGAMLSVYIPRNESNESRKAYDLMVHGTGTAWSEDELNFRNYTTLAPTLEKIGQASYETASYFKLDVLRYLNEQMLNEDGTLTVSFRLTNEGHSDALAVYVTSKESIYKPTIEIENSMYEPVLNLDKSVNVGYEPWGYAEYLVDEWFDEIVDKVYPRDGQGNLIYHEIPGDGLSKDYGNAQAAGDFTREIPWKQGSVWSTNAQNGYRVTESDWSDKRFARTLSTLGTSIAVAFLETDHGEMISEYDEYGGITNAGFKGEVTGFFHTERHGERTYIIDPLGNPFFALGMNDVQLGNTTNLKDYVIAKYGLEEVYFERITRALKETGINLAAVSAHDDLLNVENGLSCIISLNVVTKYMSTLGRSQISEGIFPFNNTINVFDPDFVRVANETVAPIIEGGGYADMPNVFGYTTDNELPSGDDILTRYLTLDPKEEPTNGFSYAVAWAWLARRMDTAAPTLAEYNRSPERQQMNDEFLCFVYSRYYRVAREAIEAVDPNHMYLGSRVNGTCLTNESYLRAAGGYLDIVSVNLYGGLNPEVKTLENLYRVSGKPFMVTEFFAKGLDAIDAHGYKLASSTGAGILVNTQQERADYYEHYALAMLETGASVGWVWYRFRDNDQGLYTSDGSNKLIMLHVTYGTDPHADTFMDVDTGEILTAAEVGSYREIYHGEAMASNQNVNKGLYNINFSSVVTVYAYDTDGELISSMAYEVEKPESRAPAEGTVLMGTDGTAYTVGRADTADGYTETVLTVYEGQYVAFADAIKNISDHMMGIVNYFDAE
ncbi:MAG: hypothetical protein J6D16_04960 [Clostridia bacterium]|nr:hypothetical protein [Clostridia bacterium]